MTPTAATRMQAIDLAVEAEGIGVSVDQVALVNGMQSERVIELARQLHEVLNEMHHELHDFAAARGYTVDEAEAAFREFLAAMIPRPRQAH